LINIKYLPICWVHTFWFVRLSQKGVRYEAEATL
jgi:hypothetical protein